MRIFKGLENVHAIIDQHEAEWRRENGEEPLQPRPRGRARAKNIERQVVERYSESLSPSAAESEKSRFDPERFSKSAEPQVKAINVIEQGDGEHHSWLYKEVMKAIKDAAEGNKNVKIVAVFVPVIQNSKEFDNFPADETVTVSSAVNEDDVHDVKPLASEPEVNNANIVEDLIPPTHIEADSELTEAFQTIEENLDLNADSDTESDSEPEANSEAGPMIEMTEALDESGDLPEEPSEPQDSDSNSEAVNSENPLDSLLSSSLSLLSSSISSIASQEAQEEIKADSDSDSESESELEESAEPLAFDEIKDENAESEESAEPVVLPEVQELGSELPDIPALDSDSDNDDQTTIELEEPAEVVELKEADEPEEPDDGFPLPDDPEDDPIIEDGDVVDSENHEEDGSTESEPVKEDVQSREDSGSENKDNEDDEDELKDLKAVEIEII